MGSILMALALNMQLENSTLTVRGSLHGAQLLVVQFVGRIHSGQIVCVCIEIITVVVMYLLNL